MKKYIIAICLGIMMFACEIQKYPHKLKLGDVVCNKAGGPKGTIFYLASHSADVGVRFINPKKETQTIGIGGAALFSGGDGVVQKNEIFNKHNLDENELKLCDK